MQQDFTVPSARLRCLRAGALIVPDAPTVLWIEGPGALACLQGILTSDLATPGDDSLAYGALLTPKGMIVTDAWTIRESTGFTLVTGAEAREEVLALLGRTLPPRLARVRDLTGSWRGGWLLGASAPEKLARATGREVPGAGKVIRWPGDAGLFAGGPAHAPFSVLMLGPAEGIDAEVAAFLAAPGHQGDAADLAAARVLTGWPTVGREIDEKTLPQEVRFDENGGVSYTKGCYTGQETVARVHFRGKVNRSLRGCMLLGSEVPADRRLLLDDKEVGSLRTAILLDDRTLGLALVRREIENGAVVQLGGREARICELPFDAAVTTG